MAMRNLRHLDLTIKLDKEEKDNFKYRMRSSHKSWYKIFTRNNFGPDNRAQCFDYSKRDTTENQQRGQAEVYASQ
jgi:hypothetical protein